MADRAHTRSDNEVIRYYNGEKGTVMLEDGVRGIVPPEIGFVDGNDKVVMVEEITNDTSTTKNTVTTNTTDIQTDKVIRTTDIRDMTAEELDDDETITTASEWARLQSDSNLWSLLDVAFDQRVAIDTINSVTPPTRTEFNQEYRTKLRGRINEMNTTEPPSNRVRPTIDGVIALGEELTTKRGNWDGSEPITFDYQWFRRETVDGKFEKIDGANKRKYTLTADDVGKSLKVRVIAENENGSLTIRSKRVDWP